MIFSQLDWLFSIKPCVLRENHKTSNWGCVDVSCPRTNRRWCKNRLTRGVTRLDGARGKKQVCRPHIWTWDLSEANVLYWRKYLWHCWDFSTPSAVIRKPRS